MGIQSRIRTQIVHLHFDSCGAGRPLRCSVQAETDARLLRGAMFVGIDVRPHGNLFLQVIAMQSSAHPKLIDSLFVFQIDMS